MQGEKGMENLGIFAAISGDKLFPIIFWQRIKRRPDNEYFRIELKNMDIYYLFYKLEKT